MTDPRYLQQLTNTGYEFFNKSQLKYLTDQYGLDSRAPMMSEQSAIKSDLSNIIGLIAYT